LGVFGLPAGLFPDILQGGLEKSFTGAALVIEPGGGVNSGAMGFDGEGLGVVGGDDMDAAGVWGGGGEAFNDAVGGLVLGAVDDGHGARGGGIASAEPSVEDECDEPGAGVVEAGEAGLEFLAGAAGLAGVEGAERGMLENDTVAIDEQVGFGLRHGEKMLCGGAKSTQKGGMKIGVVADTHGHVPSGVLERLSGVEELWHLGDVCDPVLLDLFLELGCPRRVVRGNCDNCMDWPLELDLERGGVKCHLVHIPPRRAPAGCQVLLHGHTHVPRDEMVGGVRWLNPGTVGKPNKGAPPSLGILELAEGRVVSWKTLRI